MQNMLGDKLIRLRKQNKMTQEEVADILKVTRQTVSNWELNQTKPDLEQIKGLSKLYKISIDELVENNIKEILTEKISNTEKLTGLVYNILKWMLILFSALILLSIISVILFGVARNTVQETTEMTISCTDNSQRYYINIGLSNEKIISIKGDQHLIKTLKLNNMKNPNDVEKALIEYFSAKDGSCD